MNPNNDRTAANIVENDARRHNGNKLVIRPCRHLGNGVFVNAVIDANEHGYHYPVDLVSTSPSTFAISNW